MHVRIDEIRARAVDDPAQKHLRGREHTFTNAIAIPLLFDFLCSYPGMTPAASKDAFLSESYRNLFEFCSGSPARRLGHPFGKALSSDPETIYAQWTRKGKGSPLTQSCPDFAFRSPFPHHILFEAKYFSGNSLAAARRELVSSVYQAFFYRALPPDCTETKRPDWDYDYSCLFAYDASHDGHLLSAWQEIDPSVKRGFWEGANVYVMVLRGGI